jgi:hypothetical protein
MFNGVFAFAADAGFSVSISILVIIRRLFKNYAQHEQLISAHILVSYYADASCGVTPFHSTSVENSKSIPYSSPRMITSHRILYWRSPEISLQTRVVDGTSPEIPGGGHIHCVIVAFRLFTLAFIFLITIKPDVLIGKNRGSI